MNNASKRTSKGAVACATLIMVLAGAGARLQAKEWKVWVGGESPDQGSQALAFLPSELWIQAGDSIQYVFRTHERHTLTFLTPGQIRPPAFGPIFGVPVGCPGLTPNGSSFDGSSCVTTGILLVPESGAATVPSYTVNFPSPGNFKFVCLVHADMTGAVHVVSAPTPLPHDQNFYTQEGLDQQKRLLAAAAALGSFGPPQSQAESAGADVGAGVGEILNMIGLGSQTASLMRFVRRTVSVRVGDTVEWSNLDPSINHTVTFGTEPTDPRPPSANVQLTSDGARQATIGSSSDSVNSGFLSPTPQDRANLAQAPLGVTSFRVTFTAPGTFQYICAIHDQLGMTGTVIVH
jgi:plastocyanin